MFQTPLTLLYYIPVCAALQKIYARIVLACSSNTGAWKLMNWKKTICLQRTNIVSYYHISPNDHVHFFFFFFANKNVKFQMCSFLKETTNQLTFSQKTNKLTTRNFNCKDGFKRRAENVGCEQILWILGPTCNLPSRKHFSEWFLLKLGDNFMHELCSHVQFLSISKRL